ncbi:hypothetical protein ACJX0J_006113, partial [Zea mays]
SKQGQMFSICCQLVPFSPKQVGRELKGFSLIFHHISDLFRSHYLTVETAIKTLISLHGQGTTQHTTASFTPSNKMGIIHITAAIQSNISKRLVVVVLKREKSIWHACFLYDMIWILIEKTDNLHKNKA